ncbi:MAG TPA: hypothetical protein VHY30_02510 [Verrucomicrobiae bacterium]|nr:hypothetical protein [Verrucomicrobiae bacterium]
MKKYLLSLLVASIFSFNLASAQPVSMPPAMSPPDGYVLVKVTNSLTKFDLDFPGGTPKDLVKAVEKAIGKPLNTVIPDDCADLKIPAVSVKNITVAQLFEALRLGSKITYRYDVIEPFIWNAQYNERTSTYGFQTEGVPNENSIWFFIKEGDDPGSFKIVATTVCKFYQLSPYLEAGYKVEDITTAVETAWKMFGVTNPPTMSYHKDTKVLIAVGASDKVNLIGDVLKQLSTKKPKEKSNDKDLPKSKDQ